MARFTSRPNSAYNLKLYNRAHQAAQQGMGEVVLKAHEDTYANRLAIHEAYESLAVDAPHITVLPPSRMRKRVEKLVMHPIRTGIVAAVALGAAITGANVAERVTESNVIRYDNTAKGSKAAHEACDAPATGKNKGVVADDSYFDGNVYTVTRSMDSLVIKESNTEVNVEEGVKIGSIALCDSDPDGSGLLHVKGSVDKVFTTSNATLEVEGMGDVNELAVQFPEDDYTYCDVHSAGKDLERVGPRLPTDCDNNDTYSWEPNGSSWQDIPDPQAY